MADYDAHHHQVVGLLTAVVLLVTFQAVPWWHWAALLLVLVLAWDMRLPFQWIARQSRVVLVFDSEGLEDRTGTLVAVPWSDIKRVVVHLRSGNGPWFHPGATTSVWLNDDAEWLTTQKKVTKPRNAWSEPDFQIVGHGLEYEQLERLFQHYGGIQVTR